MKTIEISDELYEKLASHAVGFDTPQAVIERILAHYEASNSSESTKDSKISTEAKRTKDTTKYEFNGNDYGKGRLVLAVIQHFVSENPSITFEELANAFPKEIQGSIGVVNDYKQVKERYETANHKRHFVKESEIIHLVDRDAVVCTEWGVGNIDDFIFHVTDRYNYDIAEVMQYDI